MDTEVLIVGAGPTGLMLGNQLARRGVPAIIIDRHSGPAQQTRALGVQARTLEIYAQLGVISRALELGKPANGANLWAKGRKTGHIPLGGAGRDLTPYPYILILGQDDNERIMGDRLRECGMTVQWNTELVGLEQNAEHATATLKLPDGTTRPVSASWVAGCDGAHSAVRELCGITFPGAPYEHVFYVSDTEVTGTMAPDEVNVYLWRQGFHLFFPMRGKDHWRIVGILPAGLREKGEVTFDDVIPSLRGEAGAALSIKGCSWFSTYRIAHRAAEHFRAGRCFLLGDAAHIHSPVGAQGMNTGLQDAYNLGWKLALVAKGQAGTQLLDSYEDERIPVARRLLATTDRAFKVVVSDSALAGLMRTQVIARIAALLMSFRRFQRFAFRTVSQIGIEYRSSRLSQALDKAARGAPQAGDRFPWLRLKLGAAGVMDDVMPTLGDTRFNLLVIGQPLPGKGMPHEGDWLRVHVVPDDPANGAELARTKIPRTSFYLLRPDGHIGLCGGRIDPAAVTRYLADRVHLTTTGPVPGVA